MNPDTLSSGVQVERALSTGWKSYPPEEGWMAEEIPFNAAQRTWERADIIVCGTPEIPYDPGTEIVIAPPLVTSAHGGWP
jgi:hypothetical protein